MKITQAAPKFTPITITLETPAEVAYLIAAVGPTSYATAASYCRGQRAFPGLAALASDVEKGTGVGGTLFSALSNALPKAA